MEPLRSVNARGAPAMWELATPKSQMLDLKEIVVASNGSRDAMHVAVSMARRNNARVRACSVDGGFGQSGYNGYPVRTEQCDKGTLWQVLRIAKSEPVNLIVADASNRERWWNRMWGPPERALIRKGLTPVLLVEPNSNWPPKNILCPLSVSQRSFSTLRWAADVARHYGASLQVLHVINGTDQRDMESLGLRRRWEVLAYCNRSQTTIEAGLAQLLREVDLSGIQWKLSYRAGFPDTETIAVARSTELGEVDLVVMGFGVEGVVRRVLGKTAHQVFRSLPCSILVV